ncbi:MAG: polymer-forming cytoskeletal protein [Oscillospiraceae bacterium]|nr:polymer-forming cytoskeletal protein [Oscillospiraceae bacterium]
MFGSKKEVIKSSLIDTESHIPTTLAEGMTSKDGKLYGSSSVKISGVFFGDIDIEGALIVAGSGSVHGNVKAEDAKIYGTIEGNVSVTGKVHIHPSGSLVGDVSSISLVADEGARFLGKSSIASKGLSFEREKPNNRNTTTLESVQGEDAQ